MSNLKTLGWRAGGVAMAGTIVIITLSLNNGHNGTVTPYDELRDPVRVFGLLAQGEQRLECIREASPILRYSDLGASGLLPNRDSIEREWARVTHYISGRQYAYSTIRLAQDVSSASWGDEDSCKRIIAASEDAVGQLPEELAAQARRIQLVGRQPSGECLLDDAGCDAGYFSVFALGSGLVKILILLIAIFVVLVRYRDLSRKCCSVFEHSRVESISLARAIGALVLIGAITMLIGFVAQELAVSARTDWLLEGLAATGILFISVLVVKIVVLRPLGLGLLAAFGLRGIRAVIKNTASMSLFLLVSITVVEFSGDVIGNVFIDRSLLWPELIVEPLVYGPLVGTLVWIFVLVVATPIGEEIIFRGALYGALRSKLGAFLAAILSGVAFGALHNYSIGGFVVVSISGMLLSFSYERCGSLMPGILVHAFNNLFLCVSLLIYRLL